jgi:hypothetical protein
LACNLATPCLSCEPKARVATIIYPSYLLYNVMFLSIPSKVGHGRFSFPNYLRIIGPHDNEVQEGKKLRLN